MSNTKQIPLLSLTEMIDYILDKRPTSNFFNDLQYRNRHSTLSPNQIKVVEDTYAEIWSQQNFSERSE